MCLIQSHILQFLSSKYHEKRYPVLLNCSQNALFILFQCIVSKGEKIVSCKIEYHINVDYTGERIYFKFKRWNQFNVIFSSIQGIAFYKTETPFILYLLLKDLYIFLLPFPNCILHERIPLNSFCHKTQCQLSFTYDKYSTL